MELFLEAVSTSSIPVYGNEGIGREFFFFSCAFYDIMCQTELSKICLLGWGMKCHLWT